MQLVSILADGAAHKQKDGDVHKESREKAFRNPLNNGHILLPGALPSCSSPLNFFAPNFPRESAYCELEPCTRPMCEH
jgi:hypothetical protein